MKKFYKRIVVIMMIAALFTGATQNIYASSQTERSAESVKGEIVKPSIKVTPNDKGAVELTLKTKTKNAEIYYTLNGKTPKKGTKYTKKYKKAIVIDTNTNVKAIACKGRKSSKVSSEKVKLLAPVEYEICEAEAGFTITWKKIKGASKYIVYKRDWNNNWIKCASVRSDETSYDDKEVSVGYGVSYYVCGYSKKAYSTHIANEQIYIKGVTEDYWGAILYVDKETVSRTGITYMFEDHRWRPQRNFWSGNSNDYWLEKYEKGHWNVVDAIGEDSNTEEVVSYGGLTRYDIDWSRRYGELSDGVYRICKKFYLEEAGQVVLRFRSSANFRIGGKKISELPEVITYDELSKTDKEYIDKVVSSSKKDIREAASQLNAIREKDPTLCMIGVRKVLDLIFSSTNINIQSARDFSEALELDINDMVENYIRASKERRKDKNFVQGEILVCFDKRVPYTDISKLVMYLSDESYQSLRMYSNNVNNYVQIKIGLDKTVDQAIEQYMEYEGVESADRNNHLEIFIPVYPVYDSVSKSHHYR